VTGGTFTGNEIVGSAFTGNEVAGVWS
jgi:hypothetical protein